MVRAFLTRLVAAEDKNISYSLHKDALQKALGQHLEDIQLTIEVRDRTTVAGCH